MLRAGAPSGGVVALLVALVSGAPAVAAGQARPAVPYFAGEVAVGAVVLRPPLGSPTGPATFLAFAAQAHTPGALRVYTYACEDRDPCERRSLSVPGSLARTGGAVALRFTHPLLGRVDLHGTTSGRSATATMCFSGFTPYGGEPRTFSYEAHGAVQQVSWHGRVGTASAPKAAELCGAHTDPGVVSVSAE